MARQDHIREHVAALPHRCSFYVFSFEQNSDGGHRNGFPRFNRRKYSETKTLSNLQGMGTSSHIGEVLLTIFKDHSTPQAEQEDADAAAKLLGVPVGILTVPARLKPQFGR